MGGAAHGGVRRLQQRWWQPRENSKRTRTQPPCLHPHAEPTRLPRTRIPAPDPTAAGTTLGPTRQATTAGSRTAATILTVLAGVFVFALILVL